MIKIRRYIWSMKKRWLSGHMTHQYKKLPVTMKIWMQFNVMHAQDSGLRTQDGLNAVDVLHALSRRRKHTTDPTDSTDHWPVVSTDQYGLTKRLRHRRTEPPINGLYNAHRLFGCWSTRGQTKSRTTESQTGQHADWKTRGPCTGQLADWLKLQCLLYSDSYIDNSVTGARFTLAVGNL